MIEFAFYLFILLDQWWPVVTKVYDAYDESLLKTYITIKVQNRLVAISLRKFMELNHFAGFVD